MMRLMIVEDDSHLATTLQYLVEDNPRYRVVGIADDLEGAVRLADEQRPDLALVDLRLANGCSGFAVAVRLGDCGIPSFFITGRAPDFPMPDLALGCLAKPFTAEDIHRSLAAAEDIMRGREALRPRMPVNLTLYDQVIGDEAAVEPGFIPSKPSLKTRFSHWIAGTQA